MDTLTLSGRREVSKQFNGLFVRLSNKNYARRLGISERTARGLRAGGRAPHKETAKRMVDCINQVVDISTKDEAELARYVEDVRRANEAKQLQISIEIMVEDGICTHIPAWFARAQKAFDGGNFEVAEAIMQDRLAAEDIASVDPVLRPYALNRLGLILQYRGRVGEAVDAYKAALETGLLAHRPVVHLAWFRTNMAGAYIRMHDPDKALEECERALESCPAHLPAFHLALCSSDALRDPCRLAFWAGRMIQEIRSERSNIHEDWLQKFLNRAAKDPDLAWARRQPNWEDLIQEVNMRLATAVGS